VKGGVGWEAMRQAYVLIISTVGSEEEVLEEVRGIPEVKEAHMVYGVYDIVARVEAETVQGLKDIVASNIRSIDKAHSTLNLVCT
jgi:DNA-binding Lrp family transcriptional regulator